MEYLENFLKEMAQQGLTPDGLRAMASRLEGLERAAGEPPVLRVKLLGPGAVMPRRGTPGSAGLDLSAAIQAPVEVRHGEITRVPTGIAIQLDPGYVCLVFGRSGLAVKEGVAPVNAVGVVDSDYRGEVIVGLTNLSDEAYTIQPGDRVAQLVIMPVAQANITVTDTLDDTERGAGGFGSTGRQ